MQAAAPVALKLLSVLALRAALGRAVMVEVVAVQIPTRREVMAVIRS
jgi:hypothetical protein